MMLGRRRLFRLGVSFVAAPSIVRVSSLMPVSVVDFDPVMTGAEIARQAAYLRALSAIMHRYLTPSAHQWFKLKFGSDV